MNADRKYITATEFALIFGKSKQWACRMAAEGRIEGARLEGRIWMIPEDAPEPEHYRRGRIADPEASRAKRLQEAAERRARREAQKAMPKVAIDPSKLEGRERWAYYMRKDAVVEGRWVFSIDENLHPDEIRGAAWMPDETEADFLTRDLAMQDWIAGRAPCPADYAEWVKSNTRKD